MASARHLILANGKRGCQGAVFWGATTVHVACSVGGAGRRGQLSDLFIEAVVPLADALIVVEGGNEDGLFDRLIEGKDIPMHGADSVKGTNIPLEKVLTGWGVTAG